jgi:hypothetical protein
MISSSAVPLDLYAPEIQLQIIESAPDYVQPEETPQEIKPILRERIREEYARKAAKLIAPFKQWEVDTWPTQTREAAAWMKNNQAATPMLTAMAEAQETTVAKLVTKVQARDAEMDAALGRLLGLQKKELAALE